MLSSSSLHMLTHPPSAKDREPQREITDWTRKGPLPDLPGQARDGGMRRGMGDREGSFRQGPPEGIDSKPRDFGNWERKGPLTPVEPRPSSERRESNFNNREPREPRAAPQWGEGAANRASQSGDRPPRPERPERQPTAADMDDKWRSKMKPDSPAATPEDSTPNSPSVPSAPAQRPRLNLAKRTVSEAPTDNKDNSAVAASSKASPFGAAKPIDTRAKEQELAEKRELAIRQKKEQDDKAREEKRAKEAAAKAEKEEKKDDAEENKDGQNKQPTEILKRSDGGDDESADKEAVDADAEGTIVADKEVKPQEITREVPSKGESSWRKTEEPQTTAETMEDDGWSTVSAKTKNFNRRGGSRAMAS
jgi:translation initiation factor 4B